MSPTTWLRSRWISGDEYQALGAWDNDAAMVPWNVMARECTGVKESVRGNKPRQKIAETNIFEPIFFIVYFSELKYGVRFLC